MTANLTLILPLTRLWNLDHMADLIRQQHSPDYDIHVLVICDNNEIPKNRIQQAFENLNVTIEYTGLDPTSESSIAERRQRITDLLNSSKNWVRPQDQYVWIVEDDTELTPDILPKLHAQLTGETKAVSAIQAGRHGIKICGIWNAPPPNDQLHLKRTQRPDPTTFETQPYLPTGKQYVHATGLYCLLVKADTYRKTRFRHHLLGPDFYFGWDICKQNGYILADWDLPVGHKTPTRMIYPGEDCISTRWTLNKQGYLTPQLTESETK